MAFGSTITVTINSIAKVLNRVNQDNYGSEYSLLTASDEFNLKIRHSTDAPDGDGFVMRRHNMYLEHKALTAGVIVSKEKIAWTISAGKYDGTTNLGHSAKGFLAYLSASSYAVIDDIVVGLN